MKIKLLCALGAGLALAAVLLVVPTMRCVSISSRKNPTERILSRRALGGFCISYTHSVNKGRVHDYYTVDAARGLLILDKTVFVSYGAGISEAAETAGAAFAVTSDGYAITNVNRQLETLIMAVGVIAEHSVSVGSKELLLRTVFAPQTSIVFEVKTVPVLPYLVARHL